MTKQFNDPFYFAVRRPARLGDIGRAEAVLRDRFGVTGRAEVVSTADPQFALCRLVGTTEAAS